MTVLLGRSTGKSTGKPTGDRVREATPLAGGKFSGAAVSCREHGHPRTTLSVEGALIVK
jgi:hypothetical protein